MVLEKQDICLIAGFNKGYLQKSMAYLETMNQFSNVKNVIMTLDFDIDSDLRKRFDRITFIRINSGQIKSPNPNKCMQHGGFLEGIDFLSDDSVIIFTDTDITLQRPFNESELQLLRDCRDDDVFVNLNLSEEAVLLDETEGLDPNITNDELVVKYPEFARFRSYNTGVFVANYRTYKKVYQKYNEYWPDFSPLFDAYVKQQLLLCYIIQKYFRIRQLSDVIHSHAYSVSISKNSQKRLGYIGETGPTGFKLCTDCEVALFNHHVKHANVLEINRLRKRLKKFYKITLFLALLLVVVLITLVNRFRS